MTRRVLMLAAGVLVCGAVTYTAIASAADPTPPYAQMPKAGDSVRLDATVGGQKMAWAYVDRAWLERYLEVTIDAAAANRPYADAEVQNQLTTIAKHVTEVPDSTPASVEEVDTFVYGGRADTEVRVMIAQGPLRGRELWTTCAELVDSAGHPYLRM